MDKLPKLLVPAFWIAFLIINIVTLKDGHNWGDDFAQYIQHAVNIVEHKPYSASAMRDWSVVVPVGFPLILSSLIYWAGINFKILKGLNILFWGLTAFASYFVALKRLNQFWAQIICVWFLTAPSLFFFKQSVLSDIPFMGFVALSLAVVLKYEEYLKTGPKSSAGLFYFLSVFLLSYAYLIRLAGVALIIAAVLYFWVVKKNLKRASGFIIGGLIVWQLHLYFGATSAGHFGEGQFPLREWLLATGGNLTYLQQAMMEFFISYPPLASLITPSISFVSKILGPIFFLLLGGLFFLRLYRRKISFLGCFTFLYVMGIILWPVQQGVPRYLLPAIVPVTIYLLSWALKNKDPLTQKSLAWVFLFLIVQNILMIGANFKFNDDEIYKEESLQMMVWARDNIGKDENYMFRKPRALGLLIKHPGSTFWIYPKDAEEWYRRIKPLNIHYLITDKQLDPIAQYDELHLPAYPGTFIFSKVWENPRYKILKKIERHETTRP